MAPIGRIAPVPFRAKPRCGRAKLRVGIFADAYAQPRWLIESLAKVATGDFAEIAVLAVRERGHGTRDASTLWQAYGQIDRWLFGSGADPLKPDRLERLVPPNRRLPFAPEDRAWRARIADLRLDVAVALGAVDEASLDGLARHGAWRHCFGEAQGAQSSLAAMREVIDEAPVVASGLRIRRGGADQLAYCSWSRAHPFSLARSRERLFGKTTDFLARTLRELHDHGDGWLERECAPAPPRAEERFPNIAETVRGITKLGARIARRSVESCFTVGQWSLAYRFGSDAPWDGSLAGFHRLMPPADRFWADPFPISLGGRHFIFFEELPFDTGKGHISVIEVDRTGHASAPVRVLERDYHVSYPFLVEDGGSLYMIPESAYNRTIEVYRCEEFPRRWRLEKVLLDNLFAADPTVFKAETDNRWWMFANLGTEAAGVDDELHLFCADRLLGEWKPHRRNPVKSDVRGSRPAGRLFREEGQLYRPAQICAPIYGSGIALNRVTRLTMEEYAEEEVRRIVPCAGARANGDSGPVLGIHTINRAGDLFVTDAFVRRRRF